MQSIDELSKLIISMESQEDLRKFLTEILTEAELSTISKRWRILNMLLEGVTQREIANRLQVSLCKVTRGSKILKDKNSSTAKYLIKEKSYGNNE